MNNNVERDILATLFKHGCVGKHNMPIINLFKHLNQYPGKEIKKAILSLRKKNMIKVYKTNLGIDVRLVSSSIKEIKNLIIT